MNRREKFLFVWILVVVAFSFFFGHFLGCAVYALEKAVALGLVPLPGLTKFVAAICSVHLFL